MTIQFLPDIIFYIDYLILFKCNSFELYWLYSSFQIKIYLVILANKSGSKSTGSTTVKNVFFFNNLLFWIFKLDTVDTEKFLIWFFSCHRFSPSSFFLFLLLTVPDSDNFKRKWKFVVFSFALSSVFLLTQLANLLP